MALRFANGMFEPVWNRQHIDHVQIDVPETLGVENRASFYDRGGARWRDMVVSHLFQVLGVVAMEPPYGDLGKAAARREESRSSDPMRPMSPDEVVRGQYEGYREIPGVGPPDSDTDTYLAARRWRPTTGAGPACRSTCAPASASPSSARR